jgi:hypothetical protein
MQSRYLKLTSVPHYHPRITQKEINEWLAQLEAEKKQLLIEPPSPRTESIEISESAFEEKIKLLRKALNYKIDWFDIGFENNQEYFKKRSISVLRAFDHELDVMKEAHSQSQTYYRQDLKKLIFQTLKNIKQSRKRGRGDLGFDITLMQKVAPYFEECDSLENDILSMKRCKAQIPAYLSDGLAIQFNQELKKALLTYLLQYPLLKVSSEHPAEHLAAYEVNRFFPSQAKYYLSPIKEENHQLALHKIFKAHEQNSQLISQLTTPEKLKAAKLEMTNQAKWWLAGGVFALMIGAALLAVTLLLHLSIMMGIIGMAAGVISFGIALLFSQGAQAGSSDSRDDKPQATMTHDILIKTKRRSPAPSISHEASNHSSRDSQYNSQQMFQPSSPARSGHSAEDQMLALAKNSLSGKQ